MEEKKQYLSIEEVAQHFNYSPQYVRTLAKKGTIPSTMVGKTWIVDSSILTNKTYQIQLYKDIPDQKRVSKENPPIIALSFFSGAMGLDLGIEKAGISVLLASEIEPNTRKSIILNKPEIGLIGDINNYSPKQIREFAGLDSKTDIDVIIGGPPCQAFSTAGKRESFNDSRGNVFLTFIDRILTLRPKFAVIENVRGLLSAAFESGYRKEDFLTNKDMLLEREKGGALLHIIRQLEEGGYSVTFNLYNSANYGSPQKRERIVIFCSRDGQKVPYLSPTHSEHGDFGLPKWRTLKEVISDLRESEQESLTFPEKRLKYYRLLKSGEYWKHLPLDLQKEALGNTFYTTGGRTGFLRRLDWNKPSPTLVTDPTMPATDLAHPVEERPLSILEYKRIQEFPDDWILFGSLKDKYRQIGNAVPLSLGYAIGKHLVHLLQNIPFEKPPVGFPYSRYTHTDERSFKELMKKKNSKIDENKNLSLFSY
ncbi:MAG: DNA cytosine methyltransferase [Spirochaetia bacterium]|nr:DNA cytosine methyltransferase [Spirochaetia bacterium]